ncbi:unnamed protein product [Phaedon cochleariae]|nr:unnamed protein product [Phaedon cochleariae]
MISLVDVILRYAKESQDVAWSRIEEAFLEFRALAAVEAARYTYRHIPLYYSSAAAIYPPVYHLPTISVYPPPSSLLAAQPTRPSPAAALSPPPANGQLRPGSQA